MAAKGSVRTKDTGTGSSGDEFASFQYVAEQIAHSIDQAKQDLFERIKRDVQLELEKEQADLKAQVDKTRDHVLAALALFATFFGFLTVNISIFTKISDPVSAGWFMLLMLCCLLSFLCVFFIFLFDKVGSYKSWLVPAAIFGMAIALALGSGVVVKLDSQAKQGSECTLRDRVDCVMAKASA